MHLQTCENKIKYNDQKRELFPHLLSDTGIDTEVRIDAKLK